MRKIVLSAFAAMMVLTGCATQTQRDVLAQTEIAYEQAQEFWIDHCIHAAAPAAYCEANKQRVKDADRVAVASLQAANDAMNGLSGGNVNVDQAISVAIQALTTYATLVATFEGGQK
jgi:hypothetical protein